MMHSSAINPSRRPKGQSRLRKLFYKLFIFSILWNICSYAFLHYRSKGLNNNSVQDFNNSQTQESVSSKIRANFQSMIEKHEIFGYGPKHPRVAFVIVATKHLSQPVRSVTQTVSSILANTDRNRILLICSVFEENVIPADQQEDVKLHFDRMDQGTALHKHGSTAHFHEHDQTDHEHGAKISVLFNNDSVSPNVAASRRKAVRLIEMLSDKHQKSGIKSPEEDIILIFIRPDVKIETDHWLESVTDALSTIKKGSSNVIDKAFSIQSSDSTPGASKSHDLKLVPSVGHFSPLANESYPTPILDGTFTALRLSTFLKLPIQDDSLDTHYASDLEMSWNLWLCGDGVEVLPSFKVKVDPDLLAKYEKEDLSKLSAIQIHNDWMKTSKNLGDNVLQQLSNKFSTPYESFQNDAGILSQTNSYLVSKSSEFNKCKSFEWYATNVNSSLKEGLKAAPPQKPKNITNNDSRQQNAKPNLDVEKNGLEMKGESRLLPSKPLRPLNKEIISRTHPIDLSYVDVSGGFVEDPHKGARDENGNYGYIFDETRLNKNPPDFKADNLTTLCNKHDGNWKMLKQRVIVDTAAYEDAEKKLPKPAKLFCLVYTTAESHDRIPPIQQTWGKKCDGFMVASTKTDKELGTVDIPHEGLEEYKNIWQKVRSMWSYVYDNYYESYDWFHIGGDDLYLIVENLKLYLESEEIRLASNGGTYLPNGSENEQYPLFLGRRFKEQGNAERMFNSGGSGYSLNKAALKALVVEGFPKCMPHLKTFAEDVLVAKCLRNYVQVFPYDTKDEEGSERYMPFTPMHHLTYKIPDDVESDWYANYSIDIKEGLEHCSKRSVAFHYVKGDLMKRMHAILYGYCDK